MSREKQPDTHRMVSARPALPPHLLRWKYADANNRVVYRDVQADPSEGLRLVRPPEGESTTPAPSKSKPTEQEQE